MESWNGKPYHSFDYMLKERFSCKIYKTALNGGMTCPNRDGTLGERGCIFCSQGGSGDFAGDRRDSITEQINKQAEKLARKRNASAFIAYFQAYTNTYAPVEYLRKIYTEAINHPQVAAVSIGTRPDCLGPDVLALLAELNQIKPVWIELGLQTIHERTAAYIRRGYPLSCFEEAVKALRQRDLEVIVHTILGLPGESRRDILETMEYLNHQDIQGIKLQLLHILKGTDLARDYLEGKFSVYTMEEYLDILIDCLEHLSPDIVIHRLTGDGPKDLLIAPLWSSRKRTVLNTLHHKCKMRHAYQGRLYKEEYIMAEPLTLYKLMILYMLEKSEFPLTNAQISGFILDKGYTTYFHLQQAISELTDSELIKAKTVRNSSYFRITPQGKQTLSYFEDQISDGIKKDIADFFKENIIQIREELLAVADYYKGQEEGYQVRCRLRQDNLPLVDLTIAVPTEEAAKAVCLNWKEKRQSIYENLIEFLL